MKNKYSFNHKLHRFSQIFSFNLSNSFNPWFYYLGLIIIFSAHFLKAQDITQIDTVFITATRFESNIYLLPVSSILITKSDISKKSISDVPSVLSGEAGIDVRNYSLINGASAISLFGSTSQQVLVLLDGLPINSPSIGIPDLGLFPVHNLSRIEIVKGPTSSLYGANALGGVINLITQNPFDIARQPEYDVGINYGAYQTSQFNLSLKNRMRNFGSVLDVHHIKTNGLRTNDDALTQGIGLVSGYSLSQFNHIRLDLRYETKEIGAPGPKPALSQKPLYGDSTVTSRYDRQWDTLYLIKASGNWQIKPNWDINLNSHYTNNNTNYLWVDAWSVDTSIYHDQYNTKTIIGNLTSRYSLEKESGVVLGIDYEHNNFSAYTSYPPDTFWNPYNNKIGIYSELIKKLTKSLSLTTNLRFDWNSDFGTFISPSIGITEFITPSIKIRTHIGRAFRAPTLNDLYWPPYGNPDIKPEIGNAFQLGFDFVPNSILSFSSTIFARSTKNLIAWSPDSAGFWRPSNVDSASISGIEMIGKIKIIDGISFQCSGTAQNPYQIRKEKIYDDWISGITEFNYRKRKQANIPSITFSSSLNIENDLGTKINIYGRYSGIRYNYYPSYNYDSFPKVIVTMQTKKLPAYFILSLHISQKLSNIINLKLNIENLYDTQYSEQFGNTIIDRDYLRPGRNLFIGIDIKN